MVVTRTPLRISYFGGQTDMDYYSTLFGGSVLSTSIEPSIYVTANFRYDERIRVAYRKVELVDDVDDLEHELIADCLKYLGMTSGIEITTIADLPGEGSGLGSSSSLVVGVLNALCNLDSLPNITPKVLAQMACEIEINRVGKQVGRQDQYAAAYGGTNFIQFRGEDVTVNRTYFEPSTLFALDQQTLLFGTGIYRESSKVLLDVAENFSKNITSLNTLDWMALEGVRHLNRGDLKSFGALLHDSWGVKRRMADSITNDLVDDMIYEVMEAGAYGAKLCGAGGGGHLLVVAPVISHTPIRKAISRFPGAYEVDSGINRAGSRVVYDGDAR